MRCTVHFKGALILLPLTDPNQLLHPGPPRATREEVLLMPLPGHPNLANSRRDFKGIYATWYVCLVKHYVCITALYGNNDYSDCSVVYFNRIVTFAALYCWNSVKGGAHMQIVGVWISDTYMVHVSPTWYQVIQCFECDTLIAIEVRSRIIVDFYTELSHVVL